MSSGLRLALGIVLPFLVLTGLGLWWTARVRDVAHPEPSREVPLLVAPTPSGAKPQAQPFAKPEERRAPSPAPAPPARRRTPPFLADRTQPERMGETEVAHLQGRLLPEDVKAVVEKLAPLLEGCFQDHRGGAGSRERKVRFTLRSSPRETTVRGIELSGPPLQSPWLEACLGDSALEVVLPLLHGQGEAVVTHTLGRESGPRSGRAGGLE